MKFRSRALVFAFIVSGFSFAGMLAGCGTAPVTANAGKTLKLAGAVHGGQQPVTGATIQLYAAGSGGDGTAATALIPVAITVTTSDGSGNALDGNGNAGNSFNTLPAGFFTITGDYTCPVQGAEVYLLAKGGNPGQASGTNNQALTMMAALGPCANLTSSTNVFVNELTTVGAIAALYPYMTSYQNLASGTGDATALMNAFTAVNEYVNTATGTVPGPTLPASTYASSYEIGTLGDAVAGCVNSTGSTASGMPCQLLFAAATPQSGQPPTDVIGALLDIVKNPTNDVCGVYGLAPAVGAPYQPQLNACPASWSLPISALTVGVSGASSVYVGGTAQYTATVMGATNQGVTWSVNGVAGGNATVGTISASGLYTAPATNSAQMVTISATSILSSTAAGSASVSVTPVTVAVNGPATVLLAQTGTYSATVTGSATQMVTWYVNGVAGGTAAEGTITTAGVYTAPAAAPSTPVTISAKSTAVTSATGTVSITVAPTAVSYATGDTRTVTQPANPAICQTLTAQFTSSQRSSPPAAASDDTARIQAALNACAGTGKAVELAASGSNNAFFSEEITVNGAGLTIDSGVTLYGGATYSSQSYLVFIKGANASLNGPGTVDGRGDLLALTSTRLVEAQPTSNLQIYNVTLTQALSPNLYIQGGSGITVWGISILTPATRTNADGIDLDSLTNVTVTNSTISAGDDGVAVKTNSSSATNITVSNNKLYGTHGLSIGSIPNYTVSNVLFLNNYLYGSDLFGNLSTDANGLVVKQDPNCASTVQQVTYQNTCATGIKHLITFYTNYSNTCTNNPGTPVFQNVIVNGYLTQSSISGAYSYFSGASATAPSSANLAYVSLDLNGTYSNDPSQYATVALDNSSFTPSGTGITTTAWSTPGSVPSCTF